MRRFFFQKMSAGWRAGCVPIGLKKCCPQSLVCFWQIRMRRTRAWNINEVKNLSRWRPFSPSRQSRQDFQTQIIKTFWNQQHALRLCAIKTFRHSEFWLSKPSVFHNRIICSQARLWAITIEVQIWNEKVGDDKRCIVVGQICRNTWRLNLNAALG